MSESGTPWGPYRDLGAPLVFHNEVRIEQAELVCIAKVIFFCCLDVFFVIFNLLGVISMILYMTGQCGWLDRSFLLPRPCNWQALCTLERRHLGKLYK